MIDGGCPPEVLEAVRTLWGAEKVGSGELSAAPQFIGLRKVCQECYLLISIEI
jgi:hypothetical protein